MGKLFRIIWGAQVHHKREAEGGVRLQGDVMTEEVGVTHFQDEGRGQEPRNVDSQPLEAGKGKEMDSPWSYQKQAALLTP